MDATTEELRHAHDALAELYADKLAHILDQMPVERAVLGLFCDLLLENGVGWTVGDIGCGPGRLAPYLAGRGLEPHGVWANLLQHERAGRSAGDAATEAAQLHRTGSAVHQSPETGSDAAERRVAEAVRRIEVSQVGAVEFGDE
ncbi:MAG: hypothetical protein ACRDS0_15220 [Pseudonocardiaceae bacterium]